ncbi:hypothetical protein CLOM_g2908 [Closterium sp. NIES-68]|nr:hypothetical protein CLOM_g2908 [Closterium sp. NIES-68]GJP79077.1 hypothetical protein CLOP_g9322 [Closterium sp. NIES-67]
MLEAQNRHVRDAALLGVLLLAVCISRAAALRRVLNEAPPIFDGAAELQKIREALRSAGFTEFLQRLNRPQVLNVIRPALNHYQLTIFAVPNDAILGAANGTAVPPGCARARRSSGSPSDLMSASMASHIVLGLVTAEDIIDSADGTKFGEIKGFQSNYVKRFHTRRVYTGILKEQVLLTNPLVGSRQIPLISPDLFLDQYVSIQGIDGIMCGPISVSSS